MLPIYIYIDHITLQIFCCIHVTTWHWRQHPFTPWYYKLLNCHLCPLHNKLCPMPAWHNVPPGRWQDSIDPAAATCSIISFLVTWLSSSIHHFKHGRWNKFRFPTVQVPRRRRASRWFYVSLDVARWWGPCFEVQILLNDIKCSMTWSIRWMLMSMLRCRLCNNWFITVYEESAQTIECKIATFIGSVCFCVWCPMSIFENIAHECTWYNDTII